MVKCSNVKLNDFNELNEITTALFSSIRCWERERKKERGWEGKQRRERKQIFHYVCRRIYLKRKLMFQLKYAPKLYPKYVVTCALEREENKCN